MNKPYAEGECREIDEALSIISNLTSAQPEHALKDCRNCKHGQYNDHWDTYFCYNSGNCEDWNLWESDIIPSAQPEQQWIPCSERLPEEKDRRTNK